MGNYFHDMLPADELAQVKFIPTFPEFVDWIEKKWGDLPAVTSTLSDETFTYSQFCGRIARKRAYLNSLGLKKGDKVAILDTCTVGALEMFLAVTSAGFVAINLPAQLPAPAVVGCCLKFGISVIAASPAFMEKANGVSAKVIELSSMAECGDPVAKVAPDDPAAIFFTGGTTGAPKGAVLPHRALLRGAMNGVYAPGPQLGGVVTTVCLLPLSHVFGLIRGTLSILYAGGHWYSCDDMKPVVGKIPQIRPTLMVLVPGLCEVLLGLTKMHGVQFLGGRLKMIISGAACVPPKLIKEFEELGIDLLEGYGMTEGANLTTGNINIKDKPTSVGKVYPEQEIKIVDGEIWFKGDNVFLGYYNDPEKTAEALTPDGWLRTGDLGRIDEEGFVYITGRIKNIIILSNGENVSPEAIEEPFYQDPAVRDCLVKEETVDDRQIIAIEILPRKEAFAGKSEQEIYEYMRALTDKINVEMPSTHRITKMTVRNEDFKRTGSLKVSRNQ